LTTNELVKQFVKALTEAEGDFSDVDLQFSAYHPKIVSQSQDVTVWSIALNDETRDVRFVTVNGSSGYVGEVVPEVVMTVGYKERGEV
jgi:hypothetical protein